MASLAVRAAALATVLVVGCTGDSEGLGATTPVAGDAALDVTTLGDVTLEDTEDVGSDIPAIDTDPGDTGADALAADAEAESAADSDAEDSLAVDSIVAVDTFVADTFVADTFVAETTTDAVIEADAAKVCLPALTTSSKGACDATVQSWPDEGANHFEPGTALTYCTKPPSSGDHYSQWAAYRVYDKPVPYGYLVHSLEHGAVVILYKCASGSCPTVQSQIVAVVNARPVDPLCVDPIKRRVIVAPDPALDIEVGASSWGWTYRATCVNAASLGKFIDDHYAKASEDFCGDGVVPP